MIVKLVSRQTAGGRIEETVFVGEEGQTMQNAGTLLLDVGEWQAFGAALSLGARQMHGRLTVVFDGYNPGDEE